MVHSNREYGAENPMKNSDKHRNSKYTRNGFPSVSN